MNKEVIFKIGISHHQHRKAIEAEAKVLSQLMEQIGYDVKELAFRVTENSPLEHLVQEEAAIEKPTKHFIDLRI